MHNGISLQWNLCIMDTLEPTKSVQGALIFQVSLQDKAPFGTITYYAGVLIFKCPD